MQVFIPSLTRIGTIDRMRRQAIGTHCDQQEEEGSEGPKWILSGNSRPKQEEKAGKQRS